MLITASTEALSLLEQADQIKGTVLSWGIIILIVGSIFFEISKIKFNPISMLISFLFKPVNDNIDALKKDFDSSIEKINDDIDSLRTTIDSISVGQDKYRFATIRWEILSFRNSLNNGNLFTENEYQHIFDDYAEYEDLHEKYNFSNGYIEAAIKDVRTHYDTNKNTNSKFF